MKTLMKSYKAKFKIKCRTCNNFVMNNRQKGGRCNKCIRICREIDILNERLRILHGILESNKRR